MASNNDPVQPTPFDAIQPAPAATTKPVSGKTDAIHSGTPRWVLPALAGLLLLAVLVIFWLPASLETAEPVAGQNNSTQPDGSTPAPANVVSGKGTQAGSDASPWSDAQAARMRKEAQEIAAELAELQFMLQERGAALWAATAFAEIATVAEDGDTLYKSRQFEQATARYREALVALQTLQEAMPQELQRLLEQTEQALQRGDTESAQADLAIVAVIDPEHADITKLQQRAEVLPQLLELLEQAEATEAAGDMAQTLKVLQQATTLDPLHQIAQNELVRVSTEVQNAAFNKAMSEGYAALDEGRLEDARQSFKDAAALQKGSAEAASALQEVTAAGTARRLTTLEKQGRQNQQQEQWQKAVNTYEQAQKIDSSVLYAREGLKRSRSRAQLDQQLRKIIDDPQRLSDKSVAQAATKLLAQSKQISPRGPLLTKQISALETLLRDANSTVEIRLRSDQETEVTVYKVARLGRFKQHELTLRPGTYTAVGSRNGYRDVRQSFTLKAGTTPAPITIICTDPI